MATSDKLQKLINTKEAIRLAINEKGGSVTTSDTFASYPNYILALNIKSEGGEGNWEKADPSNFTKIGYHFFPNYLDVMIEYSKDYENKIEENNDNILVQDKDLIYFPCINLNDDIDTVKFSASNTSTSVFNTNFPACLIFPQMDFKGKFIDAGGSYGIFYNATNLYQAYLYNANLKGRQLFYGAKLLQYANLKDLTFSDGLVERMFYNCSELRKVILDNIDLSNITSLSYMFNGCTNLEVIEGIEDLDVSNITDISYMLNSGMSNMSYLNLSKWDVRNLTKMNLAFGGNTSSRKNCTLIIDGWNLESYNSNSHIFQNLYFKDVTLNNWNLPNATTVPSLQGSNVDLELKLTNWNLPQVTSTMKGMFNGTASGTNASLKCLNLSGWNVPSLNTIDYFTRADGVIEINLADWKFGDNEITMNAIVDRDVQTIQKINIANWDFSNFSKISFDSNTSGKYISFPKEFTIVGPVKNLGLHSSVTSISLFYFYKITVDSVMVIIDGLAELEEGVTKKLSLYSNVKKQLTDEQIAIATSKGWTVA